MDPLDVAQRFIEICRRERAPTRSLTASLHESTEALGFRYFAFCARVDPLHAPPQALMIHNYPAAWAQRFSREKLYETDPVLRHAECDPEAFFWDNLFQAEPVTAAQRNMLADASSLGIAHGFTVPIHLSWLPGTLRVSCSFVPDARAVRQVNYMVANAMVTEMYTILRGAQAPRRESSSVVLSPRERQCLSLAAQGKDDWTIARLLDLSPQTVHSYFKRLMHRLEVSTRMQAVVWAIRTGQISLDDPPGATGRPPSSG